MQEPKPKAIAPEPAADEARQAAAQTMMGYNSALEAEFANTRAIVARHMAEIRALMSTAITPTIRPRVDLSGVRGVHADVGVAP